MKTHILKTSIIPILSCFVASHYVSATNFVLYQPSSNDVNWTDSSIWRTGSYGDPAVTSYYPGYIGSGVDETNCSIFFPGGQNPRNVTINVDKDVTVGAFLNEWGQYGVDLNMTSQIDGEDSSITIKATNPSSGAYQFIAVISGVSGNSYRSYTQFTGER